MAVRPAELRAELTAVEAALKACADADAQEPWQGGSRRYAAVMAVMEQRRRRDGRRLALALLGYAVLLVAIVSFAVLFSG
jgi:predicted protein tyrosine phosphatase